MTVCVRAVTLFGGKNVFRQSACQWLVVGFSPLYFPLNFQHLRRGSCGLLSSVPLAVGARVWHNKTVYRTGKGSATAISNIKRHLTDFSFCTGYLALRFSLISPSHFLHGLYLDSRLCNVRPDTWIVDQSL